MSTLEVGITADARRLNSWVLALQARGIPALVVHGDGVAALHVDPEHAAAARIELDAMDAEEIERRATQTVATAELHSRFAPFGGLLFALALVGLFLVSGPSAGRSPWFAVGSSDAARILDGEWWRTITALTLHADSNHVLANVAIGGIVVAAVMRRAGVGYGALLVIVTGALGNAINAWGHGAHHNSIGFSTAVFGAIGILGGLTFASARRPGRRPAWTAIAGALGLLAMLGANERSDMLAHLFGLTAGLAVGFGVGATRWWPRTWIGQAVAGAAALGMVGGAWALAFA